VAAGRFHWKTLRNSSMVAPNLPISSLPNIVSAMPAEHGAKSWRFVHRSLSVTRPQVLIQRRKPWSSDDLTLFQIAADTTGGALDPFLGVPPCQALRIGLSPVPFLASAASRPNPIHWIPQLFALLGFAGVHWSLAQNGIACAPPRKIETMRATTTVGAR
jgi:hypothetical protein